MSKINDGGPAFPGFTGNGDGTININGTEVPLLATHGGMSLRDWLAGQALPQAMAIYAAANGHMIGDEHFPRNCAAHAYRMADAMLAARERRS